MVAAEREFLNTSSIIPQKIFKWKLFCVKRMSRDPESQERLSEAPQALSEASGCPDTLTALRKPYRGPTGCFRSEFWIWLRVGVSTARI
jgi:hypothetical protein